jgi:hypothetical protein
MPPLLLQLWREQHPDGYEQVMIDFTVREMPAEPVALFPEVKQAPDRSGAARSQHQTLKGVRWDPVP